MRGPRPRSCGRSSGRRASFALSCPRAAACRRSRRRRACCRRGCSAIVRTPSAPPRRIAVAPERRATSSASTIALDASALGLARSASSPSRSDCSTWSSTCALAADARASDVAERVALCASLRCTSAQTPRVSEDRDEQEQDAADSHEPTNRGAAALLLLVLATPFQRSVPEDVVEELVARVADARRAEAGSGEGCGRFRRGRACRARLRPRARAPRPLREVRRRVCDLRLRAGDEEAEDVGRDRLVGPARASRAPRAGGSRRFARRRRARSSREIVRSEEPARLGRAPEPFHHELEERGLDALAVRPAGRRVGARPRVRARAARGGRVDHRLHERGLERVRRLLGRKPAVPFEDRPLDRVRGCARFRCSMRT